MSSKQLKKKASEHLHPKLLSIAEGIERPLSLPMYCLYPIFPNIFLVLLALWPIMINQLGTSIHCIAKILIKLTQL